MKPHNPSSRSTGFVLVNALVIVAAMAAAATLLLSRAEGGRVRLIATQEADTLVHALDAFEALGRTVLNADQRKGAVDTLSDTWAQATIDVPLARARVSGAIADQQALFNLNWLADPSDTLALEGWAGLLRRIGVSPYKGDLIVQYLSGNGPSNRSAYSRSEPPIAPLGGSILMIDQLASMIELQPNDITILRQHTTALPARTPVNINTAGVNVLAAMLPQLSVAQLDAIVLRRQKEPYPTIDAFFEELGLSTEPTDPDAVDPTRYSVGSRWFGADITATLDARRARRRVLFRRESAPVGTQIEWRVTQFP
ncbi:MAG: type II secretion system minor pseudopilin GspK [Sulfitobacter sp.]